MHLTRLAAFLVANMALAAPAAEPAVEIRVRHHALPSSDILTNIICHTGCLPRK
jgi:hypothetical protein